MPHEKFTSLFLNLPEYPGDIPPPAQAETALLKVRPDETDTITTRLTAPERLSLIENSFRISAGSQTAQTLYSCYLTRLAGIHPSSGPKLLWTFYTSLTRTQKLALLRSAHQTHPDNVEMETSKDIPLAHLLAADHKNLFRKNFIRTLSRQFPDTSHYQDLTHNFISPPTSLDCWHISKRNWKTTIPQPERSPLSAHFWDSTTIATGSGISPKAPEPNSRTAGKDCFDRQAVPPSGVKIL